MAAATTTTLQNVLFTLYPQSSLEILCYKDNPWFGMIPKSEKFGGNDLRISLMHAPTRGRSTAFATAQANKKGAAYTGFTLTRVTDYSLFSITNEAIKASQGDKYALVRALKSEGDAAMHILERSIATAMYRNGGGAIGQVASTDGLTLTLANPGDITNFETGMLIKSGSTDGTSGTVDAAAAVEITGIDRDLGTITKTGADWDTGGDYAANDYLFVEGDFGAKVKGLDAWLPATAPAVSDDFFGVDRSVDATRLAGVRYVASQAADGSIERTYINVAARLSREGARPDTIFTNPTDWAKLVNEIGSKTEYTKMVATNGQGRDVPRIGYTAITVMGASGPISVVADHNCPQNTAYMLTKGTWKLYSLGPCPHWIDTDGQKILRESTADAYEGRMGTYFQMGCVAPGYNARVDLTNVT